MGRPSKNKKVDAGCKREWMNKKTKKGRPTKYTKDRIEKLLALVRAGNFKTVAARAVGITSETLSQWEKQKDGFSERIKDAEAECEAGLVARITRATGEQWTAAAWMLERKNFQRWGRKEKREISGHLLNASPEDIEESVIDLYKSNPELWERVKKRVEND